MFWLTFQWKVEKKVECIVNGHMKAFYIFFSNINCFEESRDSLHWYEGTCVLYKTPPSSLTQPLPVHINRYTYIFKQYERRVIVCYIFACILLWTVFPFKVNGILFCPQFNCVLVLLLTLFYFDNGKCAFAVRCLDSKNGSLFLFTQNKILSHSLFCSFTVWLFVVHLFG